MGNDKVGQSTDLSNKKGKESATRARNRTVMLTPEMTGKMRAELFNPGETLPLDCEDGMSRVPPSSSPPSAQISRDTRDAEAGWVDASQQRNVSSKYAEYDANPPELPAPGTTVADFPRNEGEMLMRYVKDSKVVGFLVTYDKNRDGEFLPLRVGRLVVTSEQGAVGNALFINDKSVSPMHAIIRVGQSGDVQILDQLSEFGTRIQRFNDNQEEQLSGDKGDLSNGDVVFFGDRSFIVCIVANR